MEKIKYDIVELAPEDIVTERENVDYPTFMRYTYYSQTAERETPVNVLLPKNYSEDKEYTVLYILHGYYSDENWMASDQVHLSTMLNNLIDKGEAEEMIIVLPYIFCNKDMPYCTEMDLVNSLSYDNFINDLRTDLIPFIESKFSVAKGRGNTAITGFSMGGRESLFIGFSMPDTFGYIGAVCPAPGLVPVSGSAMHPGQMQECEMTFTDNPPYVLMISASQIDGVVGSFPNSYHDILTKNGVPHLWHHMSLTGHDHTSVIPHLYNFLRIIFKK